jgi:hypothetical protein
MAAVWIAEPIEAQLTEDEVHQKAVELAERTRALAEEIWPEIFASLTENGKTLFVIDLLKAQKAPGDVEALARVGEAWWRTMQARASYSKNLKEIGKGRVYPSSELKSVLKVEDE